MSLEKVKSALPDVLILGGAGAASYGAGLIYFPAGFIVAGILAAAIGIFLARGAT